MLFIDPDTWYRRSNNVSAKTGTRCLFTEAFAFRGGDKGHITGDAGLATGHAEDLAGNVG